MKSDHWNFLANLLGAPGAAEPPAQTPKNDSAPKNEPTKAAELEKKNTPPTAATTSPEVKSPAGSTSAFDGPTQLEREPETRTPKRVVDPLAFTSFRDLDDDDEPVVSTKTTQPPQHTASANKESNRPAEASRPAESTRSRGSSFGGQPDSISADDVLQALTAVTPPPRLPGFGVPSEPESPRDTVETAKKETSMWGRIAEKFGVGGDRKSEPEAEQPRPVPPKAERPTGGSGRSGFGGGLVDTDDEDELPVKGFGVARDADLESTNDDFGRPRRDSSSRESGGRESGGRDPRRRDSNRQETTATEPNSRGSSSSRESSSRESSRDAQRDSGDRGRTRRTITRNDIDDDREAIEVSPTDLPAKDAPEDGSSRRRGRRGIRQRMSEEDLDQPKGSSARKGNDSQDSGRSHEIRTEETNDREGGSRHAGSSRKDGSTREVSSSRDSDTSREKSAPHRDTEAGRGRGRDRGRGRGRGGDSSQTREQDARVDQAPRNVRGSSRHRDDDLPAHDDAFVDDDDSLIEMDTEFDEIDDDGFGVGLVGTNRDDAFEEKPDSGGDAARGSRSRSRRRGRRGRGRGNAETTPAAIAPASDLDDLDSDDGIIEANFDDDHEDDDQVEEIRRGSRRRPRSRRSGRTDKGEASADSPAASKEEPVRSARDSKPRDTQPRDSQARDSQARDSQARDSQARDSQARDVEFGDVESADIEGSRRRSSVPTWLETVELLVNANIENHNKAGSKPQRGGRGGNGGGRRR